MTFGAGGQYRQRATSTCRSLATICSGLCFFRGISSSSKWLENHTSTRTTFHGAGQSRVKGSPGLRPGLQFSHFMRRVGMSQPTPVSLCPLRLRVSEPSESLNRFRSFTPRRVSSSAVARTEQAEAPRSAQASVSQVGPRLLKGGRVRRLFNSQGWLVKLTAGPSPLSQDPVREVQAAMIIRHRFRRERRSFRAEQPKPPCAALCRRPGCARHSRTNRHPPSPFG